MAPRVPARPHHHPSPTERVDDVAPFNTTDRSRELVPRACHLPPSFPNKCNGSPRRPRLQQDRASTPPNVGHDAPSGTEASQKQNAATQYPHPTHPARHPRHESDGRVAPRPNAASQDHKFPQALTNSPRSALAPASTAHLLRGHHALLHVDNGFVEITINYARGGSAGFTSLHLNHNARRIPEETMMVSSSRQLDWMWWSRRSHASEMSYRSSPDGLGPQSELAVLPRPPNVLDAPRRARVSSERADRAASRPWITPNGISPRRHHTHLALDGLPSFQRRGSPDSWCVDDAPHPPRRPKMSARADEQR